MVVQNDLLMVTLCDIERGMTVRSRYIVFLVLHACLISNLHAGSNPVGTSLVKGYFLGYKDEAYISAEIPRSYVREIESLCKRKGTFWVLGIDSPFTCTKFTYPEEGGYDRAYSLHLRNSSKAKEPDHALLFSTKPFPIPSWTVRVATPEDIERVAAAPELKIKKYAKALRNARAGKAKVIESANGKATIVVLPWRVISDGIVEDEEFLLLTTDERGDKRLLERRGKIVGYADLNNDGIPELQISTNCDGSCESVISVLGSKSVRLEISVH